ncbi:MAG: LysR family transcriptional regulator [Pseudomonadota bacterium]
MRKSLNVECLVSANWDDFRILLAVARAGSLTGAAGALGIDQSTVSRRLSAVEGSLGAIAFIRSKSGLHPTDLGEKLILHAAEMERRAEQLLEAAAAQDEEPVGEVRLQGDHWVLRQLLDGPLPAFLELYPKLSVRLVAAAKAGGARSPASVALWFEEPPAMEEFAIRLADVPYGVFVARTVDPGAAGWVSTIDELAPRRAPARFLEGARQPGEALRVAATDPLLAVAAVRHGLGKAFLPVCLAERHRDLVQVDEDTPPLQRRLHLHAHPDTVQTLRVQAAIQWLRRIAGPAFGASVSVTDDRSEAARAG